MKQFTLSHCIQRTCLTFLLFFCTFKFSNAQKEAWNWYFGSNAGIEFSTGSPVAVTNGALNNYEGVAAISDTAGNLLFYTDGIHVYNSTHVQMPNGFGLLGDPSATQSAIIVRMPGSNSIYYIFTVDYNFGADGFKYTVVDMSLNAGLGDVTVKNVPIRSPVYEKVTAVKHGNNRDYWILINDWNADDVYAYLLDTSGFNMTPVASNAGPFHFLYVGNTAGYMKANRQGNKIALAMWEKSSFDILDFDNLTGLASNNLVVQSNDMNWTYGVEFSPDGTKLYGTKLEAPSKIYQFDLTAGSASAILNSRVTLDSAAVMYNYCALQVAPDGKIYCAIRNQPNLGVINFPDSAGVACLFDPAGVFLSNHNCLLGLPNFVPDYVIPPPGNTPLVMWQSSDTTFCEKSCIDFFDLSTNNPTSWQWHFPGADSLISMQQNPTGICYSSYGYFDVTLIACNANGCDTLTVTNFIQEYQSPAPPLITANFDTLFSSPAFSYQWYDGSGIIPGATNQYYVYQQQGSYYVVVTDSNGCMASSGIIGTGVNENQFQNELISVVPNPSSGRIELRHNSLPGKFVVLRITDELGRIVYTTRNENECSIIDLNAPSGIYFIDWQTDKIILRSKFMINKF